MIRKLFRKRRIYDLSLSDKSICSQHNLVNCMAGKNVKGSCCVRDDECNHPDKKMIQDAGGICFNCVDNVTQCECAKLNNQNNCDNIYWSTGLTCGDVPCNGNPNKNRTRSQYIKGSAEDNHFQIHPKVKGGIKIVNASFSVIKEQIIDMNANRDIFKDYKYRDSLDQLEEEDN